MTWIVLLTVITQAELQAQILATMTASGLPTSAWSKNSIWNNLIQWFAAMLQLAYAVLNDVARGAFLETATGQALIDLGENTYGTKYPAATFANGTITLLNSSGSQIDQPAGALSFRKTSDQTITYRNTADITGWLNSTTRVIPISCEQVGTVGNVPAAVGPFDLDIVAAPINVSIVEHSALVGQDDRDPDQYRATCRKRSASLSPRGGDGAYEWLALNLYTDGTRIDPANPDPTKTAINVNRARIVGDNVNGTVGATFASPSGAVDVGEFATLVAALNQYIVPSGTVLVASNATPITVDVTATITLRKGTAIGDTQTVAEQALTDYFPTSSIGGDDGAITIDELRGVLFRVSSQVHGVAITLPPTDVLLTNTEVAVAGVMTVNVVVQP